jgi:hypothetical protein
VFLALGVKTAASAKALLVLTVLGLAGPTRSFSLALAPLGAWAAARRRPPSSPTARIPARRAARGPERGLARHPVLGGAPLGRARRRPRAAAAAGAPAALLSRSPSSPRSRTRAWRSRPGSCSLALAWSPPGPRGLMVPVAAAASPAASRRRLDRPQRRRPRPGRPAQVQLLVRAAPGQRRLGRRPPEDGDRAPEAPLLRHRGVRGGTRTSGEVAYVDSFRGPALAALRADPAPLRGQRPAPARRRRVFCRARAAGSSPLPLLAPDDAARLSAAGELIVIGPARAPVDEDRRAAPARARDAPAPGPRDEGPPGSTGSEKRLAFDDELPGPAGIALGFLTAGVPVGALLLSALLARGPAARRRPPGRRRSAGMLLPFVLVNHNERHQLPLIAMQAVAIGAFAQAARPPRARRRRPAMKRARRSSLAAGHPRLYWWMATSVSDTQCTTGDEIAHLTAGYSYWTTDDYRLQPENGNLPSAGRPSRSWAKTSSSRPRPERLEDLRRVGHGLPVVLRLNGNDLAGCSGRPPDDRALRRGDRRLSSSSGPAGSTATRRRSSRSALFAFCPTMLANGALVTSDMTAACMFLAAVTAFWAMAHRLTAGRVLAVRPRWGCSASPSSPRPLIAPMCAILFVGPRRRGPRRSRAGWPLGEPASSRPREDGPRARRRDARRLRPRRRGHLGVVRVPVRDVPPVRAQPRALPRGLGRARGPGGPSSRPALRPRPRAPPGVLHLRLRPHLPVLALPEGVPERRVPEHRLGQVLPLHDGREDAAGPLRADGPGGACTPRRRRRTAAAWRGGSTQWSPLLSLFASTGPSRSRAASTSATATSSRSTRSSS